MHVFGEKSCSCVSFEIDAWIGQKWPGLQITPSVSTSTEPWAYYVRGCAVHLCWYWVIGILGILPWIYKECTAQCTRVCVGVWCGVFESAAVCLGEVCQA